MPPLVKLLFLWAVMGDAARIKRHRHRNKAGANVTRAKRQGWCVLEGDMTECGEINEGLPNFFELPLHKPVLVEPGGITTCMDTGLPYAFEVLRGDPDKLLFFFQGGGACWDKNFQQCTMGWSPMKGNGMFDQQDAENPFKDYTIIHILYCSGDLHLGTDKTYDRGWFQPKPKMKGIANTMSAIDWILSHQPPQLSSLVVSGCSAGALAAQFWATPLLLMFDYAHAAVFFDGQNGIAGPEGSLSTVVENYFDINQGKFVKVSSDLGAPDVMSEAIRNFPNVAFAALSSANDAVQVQYDAMVTQYWNDKNGLSYPFRTLETWYAKIKTVFARFNQYANFASFIKDDGAHCWLPVGEDTQVREWIRSIVAPSYGQGLSTYCKGSDQFPCAEDQSPKTISLSTEPAIPGGISHARQLLHDNLRSSVN